jgi:DNA-binding Lrp family transcriptional regulator
MLNACILLKVVPTKSDAILEKLSKIEYVRKAYDTYGRFDITIFIEGKNYQELREFTTEINSIEGIRSSETLPEA